ncbi:hypothetical protein IAD21_04052 [Abditibacteriota bacterium]|nr:hypothetical protein IAD21_04052 [Abditibacteriota bacterium]
MFRELHSDLWAIETPFQMIGMDMGARMTVARRSNGDLLAYAPFAITDEEEAAIREKGTVRDIVAPNPTHFTEIGDFARRFPDATLWSLSELDKKLADVPHQILESAPDSWNADFDSLLFDGPRGFREWVFCHRASKSLIVTDLGFQLPRPKTPINRIASRMNDVGVKFGPSRFERTLMKVGDKELERQNIETILKWDFERIVPGHGLVIEEGAKAKFRVAYGFLGV